MKKYLLIILAAIISTAVFANRKETLLKNWQFALLEKTDTVGAKPEGGWSSVVVPHDWAITTPFSRDNDLQVVAITQNGETVPTTKTGRTGGLDYLGIGWYRTQLNITAAQKSKKRFVLLFDGAMSEARVFVNNKEAIYWPYGYNAFYVDITDLLYKGGNEIAVRLHNREESSRWYPGSGLFRNVHLIETEYTHIPVWGAHIKTTEITSSHATIDVTTKIKSAKKVRMTTEIYLGSKLVQSTSRTLNGKKKSSIHQTINISWPHLWSPESPTVYTARFLVYEGKKLVDTFEQPFGIRMVEIVPNVGFKLNGQVRKFQGVCLHHDLGPLGAAVNRDAILHQLLMLKDMGCDAIRTSHNMPAPELVELCDSLGFMMMVEPFDEWDWGKCKNGYNRFFNKPVSEGNPMTWAEADMINMLRHFRNNPSVVMWSIGNEVPTQCTKEGYKVARFLQDICTREDGTRPVTCGMDGVDCVLENGFAAVMQVVGINYRAHRYQEIYDATPQKLVLGSETASTVSSRGVYQQPAAKDNSGNICNIPTPNGNSQTNQCSSYDLTYCPWSNEPDQDFANMDDFPWTIGQFVWTGFDYLGEPSPFDTDAWPSHSSYFGIIDLASIPKDRYYLYRSQWNKRSHTLHLLPHWNWNEGDTITVMAYSDFEEAELFLNGRSLGKQHKWSKEEAMTDPEFGLQRRYRFIWDEVPFEKGELKVVAYDKDGKVAMTDVKNTADKPFWIELKPERVGNVTFVRVRVLDLQNNLCPNAQNEIHISVSGNGRMLGAANGDAACLIPFQSQDQQAFNGEMTIVVEGNPKLTVTSFGLRGAELQL